MKKFLVLIILLLVPVLFLMGCSNDQGAEGDLNFPFNFSESDEGWIGDFTDYPVSFEPDIYELEFAHTDLPAELEKDGKGLMIQGHNRSDDLFMFLKKQISGLAPDTLYSIVVDVEFATEAPASAVGIGGPPGEALFVKVGASTEEPEPITKESGGEDYYQLNVDKGAQSEGGANAVVVGDGAKLENEEFEVYELKTLNNSHQPLEVTSDSNGNLWIFVGTDSGFEGKTTLYYTKIEVALTKNS